MIKYFFVRDRSGPKTNTRTTLGDLWKNKVSVQLCSGCIIHTGGLWVGEQPVRAYWGVWSPHRATRGSLCQPEERKEGIFLLNNHVGLEGGGLIIKFPVHPCIGFGANRGAGDLPKKLGSETGWKEQRGSFCRGGCTFWHNDPYVFSLSLSRVFVRRCRVMGGKRAIQGGN